MISTTLELQSFVLKAILDKYDKSHTHHRLEYAISNLSTDHFVDEKQLLFDIITKYYLVTDLVADLDIVIELLKRAEVQDEEIRPAALQLFIDSDRAATVEEAQFRYKIHLLREDTKKDALVTALKDSMDILLGGKKIQNKMLHGFHSAASYISNKVGDIEAFDSGNSSAVTFQHKDVTKVLQVYSDKKHGKVPLGFATGIPEIDEATSGFNYGDLVFIPGYTSEGKSSVLYSMIDYWVYKLKLNVVIATAESSVPKVQARMVCIRSADPRYQFHSPIDYKKYKEGKLDRTDENNLVEVVKDLHDTTKYGMLSMFPIPEGSTSRIMYQKIFSLHKLYKVDLFGYDYINYSTSDVDRRTDREEGNHLIKEAKVKTTNFDSGRGLITVSPFQVSRGKYEKAYQDGRYNLTCMQETPVAEQAADVVMSILNKDNHLWMQLLKNRDGPKILDPFEVYLDKVSMRVHSKARPIGVTV